MDHLICVPTGHLPKGDNVEVWGPSPHRSTKFNFWCGTSRGGYPAKAGLSPLVLKKPASVAPTFAPNEVGVRLERRTQLFYLPASTYALIV